MDKSFTNCSISPSREKARTKYSAGKPKFLETIKRTTHFSEEISVGIQTTGFSPWGGRTVYEGPWQARGAPWISRPRYCALLFTWPIQGLQIIINTNYNKITELIYRHKTHFLTHNRDNVIVLLLIIVCRRQIDSRIVINNSKIGQLLNKQKNRTVFRIQSQSHIE